MFTGAEGCVYPNAFRLWREQALEHGIALDTMDMKPAAAADCVWMMDLPRRRSVFDQVRKQVRPEVPFVLQVVESPIITPQSFVATNRDCFDAVVSYEPGLDEGKKHFSYHLPNTVQAPVTDLPFRQRRCVAMLNSNRMEGFFAMRQPGVEGLPGIGRHLSGWRLPVSNLINQAEGELYSWRRELALQADRLGASVLDVYGHGWKGEQLSWLSFYGRQTYQCATAAAFSCEVGSENRIGKYHLLSHYRFGIGVENFRGKLGYISEKLFDVLASGAVPVYLGEEKITAYVPEAAFVDARNFRNQKELLLYLKSCDETEWRAMRDAGQAFLHSGAFHRFSDEAFANRMVEILKRIL